MSGLRSSFGCQFIDDSGVGEGAFGHNLVVTSSGSISIEINLFNASVGEISGSRGVLGDAACR